MAGARREEAGSQHRSEPGRGGVVCEQGMALVGTDVWHREDKGTKFCVWCLHHYWQAYTTAVAVGGCPCDSNVTLESCEGCPPSLSL
jgi:hypothetical protein